MVTILDAGEVFPVGFVVYEDGVGVSHRDVDDSNIMSADRRLTRR